VLHLAASTFEASVERALVVLLAAGAPFDYAAVREHVAPIRPEIPQLPVPREPDFAIYDALLTTRAAR
jgi:hypothetical protein